MNNAKTPSSRSFLALEGISLGRWEHGGFVAFVDGEIVREHRHHNPRVFTTPEKALEVAKRARRK